MLLVSIIFFGILSDVNTAAFQDDSSCIEGDLCSVRQLPSAQGSMLMQIDRLHTHAKDSALHRFSRLASNVAAGGIVCMEQPCMPLASSAPEYGGAALLQTTAGKPSKGQGRTATLDQAGYAKVANLKSDKEMCEFIKRMISKYDCEVVNEGGLMGIVPWFSGTTTVQDLPKLEATLLYSVLTYTKNPWLIYKNSDHITGDTAKLGFEGYVQVAALRNDVQMKQFVRRLCKVMKIDIIDEGGFEGMVHFYSGTDNFQSFERLQEEIRSAANAPHAWAQWDSSATEKDKQR